MYKKILVITICLLATYSLWAGNDNDTVNVQTLEEVSVVSTRNADGNNLSASNIGSSRLTEQNFGQNLPFLLSTVPSLVTTSDDGLGVGYTYFRIRGTDHTRINMTVNGIPLNDSESQTVFWVNMTDFASSLKSVQVQRGVGTSTNGSAAFGASVNMQTAGVAESPYATVGFNGGMYNTLREVVKVGTGIMPSSFVFDAKFSKVNSDGYLERAFSDLYSYSASAGYVGTNSMVKLIVFGGKEKTYMAWDGIGKKQLAANRRFNPAGADYDESGNIVGFYDNQTDNYRQNHIQLHFSHFFMPELSMNAALHYTKGSGYYEQFKDNAKLKSYNLSEKVVIDGKEVNIKLTDIVRRKNLDNDFFGGVWSLNYVQDAFDLHLGGALNRYDGAHFGNVIFARNYPLPLKDFEYYRNNGQKTDGNVYLKGAYRPVRWLSIFGDLQYRYVGYTISGTNDQGLKPIEVSRRYHFFNPKAGIAYSQGGHNTYASFSVANREPSRSNFTEAGANDVPLPERLFDYELGYNLVRDRFSIGANLYFMNYKNQLVLTGKYSDTGAYLTQNVAKSYRTGIEIVGGVRIFDWLSWDANITLSRNKIIDFADWFDVYEYDPATQQSDWKDNVKTNIGTTDISFSPSITAGSRISISYKGFGADVHTTVVGSQYLSNVMNKDASLPAYSFTNVVLSYKLPVGNIARNITFSVTANNVFNSLFVSNGGAIGSFVFDKGEAHDYSMARLQYTPWFYAQAGFNIHGGVTVDF